MSHAAICAPRAANSSAMARPMPEAAPLMNAIRPSSRPLSVPSVIICRSSRSDAHKLTCGRRYLSDARDAELLELGVLRERRVDRPESPHRRVEAEERPLGDLRRD